MSPRKAKHRIADIHYEPHNGPSWLECTDGTRLDAASPYALSVLWEGHGGSTLNGVAEADRVRKPECGHPQRKHYANGQCQRCYMTDVHRRDKRPHRKRLVGKPMAECHPERRHYAKGQCSECYEAQRRQSREADRREPVEHKDDCPCYRCQNRRRGKRVAA